MAAISQGVVSLAGTPADRRRSLARVAKLKPRDLVFCQNPDTSHDGWYAIESGNLVRGLMKAKLAAKLSPRQQALWLRQNAASVKTVKLHAPSLAAQLARKKIGAGRKWSPIELDVLLDDEREVKVKLSSHELKSFLAKIPLTFGGKTFYARPAQPTRDARKTSVAFAPLKKGGGYGFVVTQPANAARAIAKIAAPASAPSAGRRPSTARNPGSGQSFAKSMSPKIGYGSAGMGGGRGAGGGGGGGGSGGPPPSPRPPGPGRGSRIGEVQVYPNIVPSSEHVVERTPVDITVSLQDSPAENVTGEPFTLPPGEHLLQVHVMLGDDSAWDTLRFNHEGGTLEPAQVRLLAPHVPPDGLSPIIANFYFQHRWCGEARRNLEVLNNADSGKRHAIPKPELSPWQQHLHLVAGAAPPDLLVRIVGGRDRYTFSVVSPHMNFAASKAPADIALADGAARFVERTFEDLAAAKLTDDHRVKIQNRLRRIYDSTPELFRQAYWQLAAKARAEAGRPEPRAKLETIQFVSDEAFVPWELMVVTDPAGEADSEILAVKHAVGRWFAKASCRLSHRIPVRQIAAFASDYARVEGAEPLTWAREEQTWLNTTFHAQRKPLRKKSVQNFLTRGRAQGVHFCCHGEMDPHLPEDSTLWLEDFKEFTTESIPFDEARRGLGAQHPLVFLNACQIGAQGQALAMVTGWPKAFLDIGASACIAPLWSVSDSRAKAVARHFYELTFRQKLSIGEALRQIRETWRKERSLTFLSYALYGDPSAKVEWTAPKVRPKPTPAARPRRERQSR